MTELCEIIRAKRTENGLTMMRLGELLGYRGKSAENTVQQWESGKRKVPIKKWRDLCRILDLSIELFMPQ